MQHLLYKHDLLKETIDIMEKSDLFDDMMMDLQFELLNILKGKIIENVREKIENE
ncbi:hypothetical protein [Helcococcus kunzii]|uniref:hypothetical protein n=1 Tax=Helcococcus kunzii TaxID=40091 RepID=UPI0038B029C9